MFELPVFNAQGEQIITRENTLHPEMLMDTSVFRLKTGDSRRFFEEGKEIAVLLIKGKTRLIGGNIDETAERTSLFEDLPVCLHVCKGTEVTVTALEDSEIFYAATTNQKEFSAVYYNKTDVIRTVSCEGLWENTAVRDVNTLFDYDNAPYSNLVLGEVLARQGRWWSYVPHSHPQPEVYYYKFDRPEGFGACFEGETAHFVKDGCAAGFIGGTTHAQVTAPGFPMYNIWIIRHLDGNPWIKTRNVDPRYVWLDECPKFVTKK